MHASHLVAHRGYPSRYPENTLVGFQAAVAAGAVWLETDIQLSGDQHPVLYHDATLQRVSNRDGEVWDHTAAELAEIGAADADRFGDRHVGEPIATLSEFVGWCLAQDLPNGLQLLVELKPESLARFGSRLVIDNVRAALEPLHVNGAVQCTLISKQYACLDGARHGVIGSRLGSFSGTRRLPIGWVLPAYDEHHRRLAVELQPEWLICNQQRLPRAAPLWPGPWRWMAYTVNDLEVARQLTTRGIELIETDDFAKLSRSQNAPN